MATIQDVARAAGVSPMTVSNVINDHPHVKSSTRAKVVKAMEELDYRVNHAARNLRAGRTFTIGLAVPEFDRPFWGHFATRVIEEAAAYNLRVLVEQTGRSKENEINALALSRNRMYDGLILSTVGLSAGDANMLRVDYPVVILGERIFSGPVDHVAMDNVDGAKAATAHLIERGCRRIAAVMGPMGTDPDASSLRYAGYLQALETAAIGSDSSLHVTINEFTLKGGREAVDRLLHAGTHFDGLFCATDTVALGALRALHEAKLRVPEDVKVIGFDNLEEGEYSIPALSTVDPDSTDMARTAVKLLVQRISGESPEREPLEFISSVRVIARGSTAAS
ncbi:LacI family DNA-binding transcriptional regulator [Arthrobacter sp. ISL-85]|uniref:LacI family DNA-binding transcriptional regulator n=1 Tax=Arthrobacter sp. ISL-85 TaxID=2819115 RepID=UPI001BEAD6B8|nr:LacI family DNA-binding transcriptional regulator [Arthrobacter sp. ISL-85]MBT2568842.1 LacI family DNA-binding transcriptional regulator [Arthrobacter sp. ISL-85]